jgi:hypothetical protein
MGGDHMAPRYYMLVERMDQTFDAAVKKFESIYRPGGCRACSGYPVGIAPPSPLRVRLSHGKRMQAVFPGTSWGFCVAHVDLIECLGDEVREHLLFGTLAWEHGGFVEDYKSLACRHRVLIREGPRSVHRVCPSCGMLVYTCWPDERPYVVRHALRAELPVYEYDSLALLIREDLHPRIAGRWTDLKLNQVEIVDTPKDNLSVELDLWPTPEQLVGYKPNSTIS